MSTLEREVYALTQSRTQSHTQQPQTGPQIVVHVGAQTLRLPAATITARLSGALAALDTWKATANGQQLAVYAAFKTALNVGFPFVVGLVAASGGLLPPLPQRRRHSDPIAYLLGYLVEALPLALARGEWTLGVDASGDVTALDWSAGTTVAAGEDE